MRLRQRIACVVVALSLGAGLSAHIRLINPSNHAPLHWNSPANISIVINATGSDDVTDQSHIPALQGAFRAWNASNGTLAHLVENTSASQRARTDWQANDIHTMFFDETNSSGYFTGPTGIVALTPVSFTSSGSITDADVLFNGSEWQFTTSGVGSRFDIEDVGTHELGHLLGLDHSAWAGATMYPYVDPTVILHRSLAQDDVCGLRDAYPSATFGSITGTIRRSDDSVVPGATVVARSADGRPFASALADNNGNFAIRGLPAGDFTLYATPLDAPVSSGNITSGHTVQTDFGSTMLGAFTLASGQGIAAGDLTVGPDVVVSLGRSSDVFPVRCVAGQQTNVTLHGTGLSLGSSLAASDATIGVTPLVWSVNQVSFRVTVPAGSPAGHVDLTVTTGTGDTSTLCAGLEITPPDPVISSALPATLSIHGGTALTIHGSNFANGARVVIGPNIYADGEAGGSTVVDDTTITLTTAPTPLGQYDVLVIDSTGVEGRLASAVQFHSTPAIATVFPQAGSSLGGTVVTLSGADFEAGLTVDIDGVAQSNVVVVDATHATVTTDPGLPGGPYVLTLQNPDGEVATSAFSYSINADPTILTVTPGSGKKAGGNTITIAGTNFTPACDVFFGSDANSGAGGTSAASVTFVDANTLTVMTPAHASGTNNVMVLDNGTGQAALAANAFTFQSSKKGGGCSVLAVDLKSPPFDGFSSSACVLVAFALLLLRASRSQRSGASRPPVAC